MSQMIEDTFCEDPLVTARKAHALGQYNQATSILLDILHTTVRPWAIRLELALNYLHQGYLKQAITTLNSFTKSTAPLPDNIRQRDTVVFLAICINVRAGGRIPLAWEPCLRRVWECHLRKLSPTEHTCTDVSTISVDLS